MLGSNHDPNIIKPTKHIPAQPVPSQKKSANQKQEVRVKIDPKTERRFKLKAIIELLASSEQLQYLLEDQTNSQFTSSQFKDWVNAKLLAALLSMNQDKQGSLDNAVTLIEQIFESFTHPKYVHIDEAFLFLLVVNTTVAVIQAHQRTVSQNPPDNGIVLLPTGEFYQRLLRLIKQLVSNEVSHEAYSGSVWEPLIRRLCSDIYLAVNQLPSLESDFEKVYSEACRLVQQLQVLEPSHLSTATRQEIQKLLASEGSGELDEQSAIRDERTQGSINELLNLWAYQITAFFLDPVNKHMPLYLDAYVPSTMNIPPVLKSSTFSLSSNLTIGTLELVSEEFSSRIKEKYIQMYVNQTTVLTKKVKAAQFQSLAFRGSEKVPTHLKKQYLPKFSDLIRGINNASGAQGARLVGDLVHDYDVTVVYENQDRLYTTSSDTLLSDVDLEGNLSGYRLYFNNNASQAPQEADSVRLILKADFALDDFNNLNHMLCCKPTDTFRVVANQLSLLAKHTGYNEPIKEEFLANIGKYVTVSSKSYLTVSEKKLYQGLSQKLGIDLNTPISKILDAVKGVDKNRPNASNMVDLVIVLQAKVEATERYLPLFESTSAEESAEARVFCDIKFNFDHFLNWVLSASPEVFHNADNWTDQQVLTRLPALLYVPFGPLTRLVGLPTEFSFDALKEVVAKRELGISNQYRASAFIYKDHLSGEFLIKQMVTNTKDQVSWFDGRSQTQKTASLHHLVGELLHGVLFVRKEPDL